MGRGGNEVEPVGPEVLRLKLPLTVLEVEPDRLPKVGLTVLSPLPVELTVVCTVIVVVMYVFVTKVVGPLLMVIVSPLPKICKG